jgi:outer membrane lipoprotein-sorting protein
MISRRTFMSSLLTLGLTFLSATALDAAPEVNIEPVKKWIEKQATMKSAIVKFTQERRLRTLKKPIVKEGKFWFRAPSTFRWEIGDPAEMIAVQQEKEDLFVVKVKDKEIDQYPYEKVVAEGSQNGLSFLESGFPRDLASFQKNFSILSVKENQGFHEVQTKLTDRRASLGCRKIVFFLDLKSHELRHVHLYFRDGSVMTNRFQSMQRDVPVPDSTFSVSTDGFTVNQK